MKVKIEKDCVHELVGLKKFDENCFLVACKRCKLVFGMNKAIRLLLPAGVLTELRRIE